MSRLPLRVLSIFAILLLAVVFIGCSKNDEAATSSAASGTFTNVYQRTLSTACIECHKPGGAAGAYGSQLDFTTKALAYSTLSTVVKSTVTTGCSSVSLAHTGNPSRSYILGTLGAVTGSPLASYNTGFPAANGGCTPYAGHTSNLSQSEADSLVAWINAGVPNN